MIRAKQKELKGPKIRYPYDVGFEIARFAAKGIHEFRKGSRHGYPSDITPEKWEEILAEMEWALSEVGNDFPHNPYNIAWDIFWRNKDAAKPNYSDYQEEVDKYNQRITEGLHTFASRLCDLWD